MIGDSRFTIRLAIVFCLSFFLCVAKVVIVIRLVYCVGGCAMLMLLAFHDCDLPFLWHATVIRLRDCDWLVSYHAIVIRLAFRNGDSRVDLVATLRDGDSLVRGDGIVSFLSLHDAGSLDNFDHLVADDCFLAVVVDSLVVVSCETALAFL